MLQLTTRPDHFSHSTNGSMLSPHKVYTVPKILQAIHSANTPSKPLPISRFPTGARMMCTTFFFLFLLPCAGPAHSRGKVVLFTSRACKSAKATRSFLVDGAMAIIPLALVLLSTCWPSPLTRWNDGQFILGWRHGNMVCLSISSRSLYRGRDDCCPSQCKKLLRSLELPNDDLCYPFWGQLS